MNYTTSQESHALATTAPRGMGFDLSPQSFEQAMTFANMDSIETPEGAALAVLRHWLLECLAYDHITGLFAWRVSPAARFQIGMQAGSVNSNGYIVIRCNGPLYLAHRLAWLFVHGEWPKGDIDHINGDRSDNRIKNLRDVTRSVNQQNLKRARIDNKTGLLGAKRARNGNFEARINVSGRYVHIGTFKTAAQAHEAYISVKRNSHQGNTL